MNKPVVFAEHNVRPAEACLFVDPRIADWELLAQDVPSSTRATVLDVAADGVTQIATAIEGVRNASKGPRRLPQHC